MAVNSLNKKFIGNAHLRLTLTCPLPDEDSTLPTSTELNDPRGREVLDARDLARHLVRVNASGGFEPDVFRTQSWIGKPSPRSPESGSRHSHDPFRAPYHTPTPIRPSRLHSETSPGLEPFQWDKATESESPLQTPTKNRPSNISRRLDDLYGTPITPERKKKTVEFNLQPKPTTLIEQLNAKFANLHSPFVEPAYDHGERQYSDEEDVKPFRDDRTLRYNMKTSSLPATPYKTSNANNFSDSPTGIPQGLEAYKSFPTPSPIRQPYSLHTTPQHVARIAREARQVEIMKNVPKDMMLDMEALRTGRSRRICLIDVPDRVAIAPIGRDPRTSVMIKDIPVGRYRVLSIESALSIQRPFLNTSQNKLTRKQLIDCIQEVRHLNGAMKKLQ